MAPNYPVNLRWRVLYLLVRGFRVVDVARILHVWQEWQEWIEYATGKRIMIGVRSNDS